MMIRRLLFCLMAMVSVLTLSAQSIYDFKVKNDAGQEVSRHQSQWPSTDDEIIITIT